MKSLFLLSLCCLLSAATLPLAAQEEASRTATEADGAIPQWLADLSNLPREQRQEYIEQFALAKNALATGDWISCDAALTTCELIFTGNPHICNMRAACYIEQKRYADAAIEVAKAREQLPNDPSTLVNLATLHMAQGEYKTCIDEMSGILEANPTMQHDVRDILTFRLFLCHLKLHDTAAAMTLVEDVSPLSDSPLYYYSRAAVCLYNKDLTGAKADLQSAARIFQNAAALVPYQRALLNANMSMPEKRGMTTDSAAKAL